MTGAGGYSLRFHWSFKNGTRKMCSQSQVYKFSWAFFALIFVLVSSSSSSSDFGSYSDSEQVVTLHRCCPPGSSYNFRTHECIKTKTRVILQSDTEITTAIPLNLSVNFSDSSNSSNNVYSTDAVTDDDSSSSSVSDFDLSDSLELSVPKSSLLVLNEQDVEFNSDNSNNSFKSDDTVQFKLMPRSQSPKCSKGNFTVQININSNGSESDSSLNEEPTTIMKLTSTGLLRIGMEYYSTPEYCLAGLEGDTLTILVCNATCGAGTPCIRKCCDLEKVWDQSRGGRQKCAPAGQNQWSPILYSDYKRKASQDIVESLHPHYQIIHPRHFCTVHKPSVIRQTDPHGNPYTTFRILTNGEVIRRLSRYAWYSTPESREFYCVDGGMNAPLPPDNLDQPDELGYSGNDERDSIFFDCGPEDTSSEGKSQSILYGVVMMISCIFLLLTILVYILLWEKQTVHGWTLMCYVTSLFFMYLFFVMMYFSQITLIQDNDGNAGTFCYFIAVGLNFFFLSTFCWMSMINFDLFTTFKALKPTAGRSKGLKRFLAYAAFSLIVPVSIVAVALSLDKVYGFDADSGVIVPEYGRKRCQLDPEYAQLVYAYGPAGVLLIFNLIFFTNTLYTMYQIQQTTKFATSSSSKNNQQKQSMRLFAKLLFVMGIPWIFEIISWAVEHNRVTSTHWFWVIFDLINILQAIAIFYIFVCKRDIIHSLEQKYPPFKRFLDRVLMDSDKADRITENHPKIRGFIKPITRRVPETTSNYRSNTNTETTTSSVHSSYPESVRRDNTINLQTRKQQQQSTTKHSMSTKNKLDVDSS